MATLANKDALLKLTGIDRPVRVKLHLINTDGVLVLDKNLASALKDLAKDKGLDDFIGESPLIFFPHCRVDWIMARAE